MTKQSTTKTPLRPPIPTKGPRRPTKTLRVTKKQKKISKVRLTKQQKNAIFEQTLEAVKQNKLPKPVVLTNLFKVPVYKIPIITEQIMEETHRNAILVRKHFARVKELKKENDEILFAVACENYLQEWGFEPTNLDEIWGRREDYQHAIYFGYKAILEWYRLFRGFIPHIAKKQTPPIEFDAGEIYWETPLFKDAHDASIRNGFPTENILFRREFSDKYYDQVPEGYQKLFIDNFPFQKYYSLKAQQKLRLH